MDMSSIIIVVSGFVVGLCAMNYVRTGSPFKLSNSDDTQPVKLKRGERRDKRKNSDGKYKTDGTFVGMDGTEYEIEEDPMSGSIYSVRKTNDEWLDRYPVEVIDVDQNYMDEVTDAVEAYHNQLNEVDSSLRSVFFEKPTTYIKQNGFNYKASEIFDDDSLLVEMPIAVQDWQGFPRGAWINNIKHVGDIVQLIDGSWVQVAEVLDDYGRYRMKIIDEPKGYGRPESLPETPKHIRLFETDKTSRK